jgi:hypothetical protein
MADTDLPNGFGAIEPAPRRVRPIASPFGMLPTDGLTPPQPGPPPGFNVQPDTTSQTNPMSSLLASLTPSRVRCRHVEPPTCHTRIRLIWINSGDCRRRMNRGW